MRVYIGFDPRPAEVEAFHVAAKTARKFDCEVIPLREDRLRAAGILTRATDRRGGIWDLNSDAPQSTEFAISRFAVPLLAHSGFALFVDADVVFMRDPRELIFGLAMGKAVYVVKHNMADASGSKMDGQIQSPYPRKNWSSVAIYDCEHPANRRLNVTTLNQWPGRDLHAFGWLNDDEIGELPPEANWLVGLQPKPERPIIAHFTSGTPNMPGYENSEHADIWYAAKEAA